MTVAELFVKLGIKGNIDVKKALTQTSDSLREGFEGAKKFRLELLAMIVGIEEMSRHAIGTAMDLDTFSNATGLSTAQLQKWGYIAKINNISFDELTGTIKGLQNAQAALRLGKGIPEGALWFGIDPKKNPIEMFAEISKKIRSVSNKPEDIAVARSMAQTLGISDSMFAMFRRGNIGANEFNKNLAITTEEEEKLVNLGRDFTKMWEGIKFDHAKTIAQAAGKIELAISAMTAATHAFYIELRGIESLMRLDSMKKFFDLITRPQEGAAGFVGPMLPPDLQREKENRAREMMQQRFKEMGIPTSSIPNAIREVSYVGDTNISVSQHVSHDQASKLPDLSTQAVRGALSVSREANKKGPK